MSQKSFVEITDRWDTAMSMRDFTGKWKFVGADLDLQPDPDELFVAMQKALDLRDATLFVLGLRMEDEVRKMVEGLAYA